jgi:hypothetical protein
MEALIASEVRTVMENIRWDTFVELATLRRGSAPRMIQFGRLCICTMTFTWLWFCLPHAYAQEINPCRQAHAHNDYLHTRPLLDALDAGFCSVEADIFLVEGKLLVAHTKAELSPERTLQTLYLDPLRARIQRNEGKVQPGVANFTLLIDIKTDGITTYRELHTLLSEYRDVFSFVEDGKQHPGAVTAIVSGNRPIDAITAETLRFVGLDGRLTDLESKADSNLIPLISDNWTMHFKWRGVGELPVSDREKLASIVERVHMKKRVVRFWGAPDNANAWAIFQEAGVDLINTDNLKGLSEFLRSGKREPANR